MPPMGDVPIAEALSVWKDKTLWLGFPGSVYVLGPKATQQFALGLLREIGSTDRLAIAMSTENQVSNDNLLALTAVLENAELPLLAGDHRPDRAVSRLRFWLHAVLQDASRKVLRKGASFVAAFLPSLKL